MGCTIKQAKKTLWNNHPGNDTNPQEHLQPILRAITRLGEHLTTKADFTAELFQGCLSAYYSPDAIYNLRHSDPKDSFQMVEELQAMWESKPTWERSRIHKLRADAHTHYSQPRRHRDRWTGPRDANRTPFREGEPPKSKGGVKSAGQSWGGVDQRETLQGGSSLAGQCRTGACYTCGKVDTLREIVLSLKQHWS